MTIVIASAVGYDGTAIRQPDEKFNAPLNAKGEEILKANWYAPVSDKPIIKLPEPVKPAPVVKTKGGNDLT